MWVWGGGQLVQDVSGTEVVVSDWYGGEQWGTRGAALCRQSGVSLGTAGELGTEDFMIGKEHRSVLAGRCLSRHPPPPLPQAALSLQVAMSPCQVLMLFWDAEPASGGGVRDWGPTSCRDSEGLGSRSRAWENRPSKLLGNSLRPRAAEGSKVTAER